MKHPLILGALLLACVTSTVVTASTTDSLQVKKVAMIKEGIYFYSNVPELNTSPEQEPISDCGGDDSASVMKCAELLDAKAQAKVRSWFTLPLNNAEDLKKIGDKIISDVIPKTKEDRKKFPAFATLNKHIYTLAIVAGENEGSPATRVAGNGVSSGQKKETAVPPQYDNSLWLLYCMSILALVLAAVALYIAYKGAKKPASNTGGFGQGNSDQYEQLQYAVSNTGDSGQAENKQYEVFKTEVAKTLDSMNEEINNMKDKEEALTRQIMKLTQEKNEETYNKNQSSFPSETVPHPALNTQKLYAKSLDGNNGFVVELLSTEQDNKMIYELTVENNHTATFEVTANKEAQLLALEDVRLYLGAACSYSGQPKADSRIITKEKGTLQLERGKWKITKQAIIDFE